MVRRLAPLLALVLAACSDAPAREAGPAPLRIASLNPCTDAILAEVADPEQIAGLSRYSSDPAASSMDVALARRFPALSGTAEEVLEIRPDLVLGTVYTPPATVQALNRLGMRLERFDLASDVPASLAQIRRIAALAGHPERGEALIARIEQALRKAAPPPGTPAVPALIWQSGGMVPGQDTLIAALLVQTGFANVAAERGLKQADLLPLEQVLADPPRVIFSAGDLHGNEDRMLRHPALGALTGAQRVSFDPALLWCGGPTIERAALRLSAVRKSIS